MSNLINYKQLLYYFPNVGNLKNTNCWYSILNDIMLEYKSHIVIWLMVYLLQHYSWNCNLISTLSLLNTRKQTKTSMTQRKYLSFLQDDLFLTWPLNYRRQLKRVLLLISDTFKSTSVFFPKLLFKKEQVKCKTSSIMQIFLLENLKLGFS